MYFCIFVVSFPFFFFKDLRLRIRIMQNFFNLSYMYVYIVVNSYVVLKI